MDQREIDRLNAIGKQFHSPSDIMRAKAAADFGIALRMLKIDVGRIGDIIAKAIAPPPTTPPTRPAAASSQPPHSTPYALTLRPFNAAAQSAPTAPRPADKPRPEPRWSPGYEVTFAQQTYALRSAQGHIRCSDEETAKLKREAADTLRLNAAIVTQYERDVLTKFAVLEYLFSTNQVMLLGNIEVALAQRVDARKRGAEKIMRGVRTG